MNHFDRQLKYGQAGESSIAKWLRSRGNSVLPVYEKIFDTGKGPRLFVPEGELIAPDLLVFGSHGTLWIEAKHKTAFAWHRISQQWVTGVDLKHYKDYLSINTQSPWPVWLLFLHDGGQAKDSPPNSPRGLFGNSLSILEGCEDHRHGNWGKSGMVYWAITSLICLASLGNEVRDGG